MSDIFVSYKRENLAAVGRLVEALRAEGIGVWWDQDIAPNAAWEATIEQQLAAARLVIVAWSPAAVASENVKAEARWARQHGLLLQVFVEACEPPLFFGERQGVDLKLWSGQASDGAFRRVLAAVREGLDASRVPLPDTAAVSDTPLPLPSKPSIAVMPFANLSGDPEQEYFADGMVEEVVNALSRFRSLFVIGSGSTLTFKGKAVSPQEVARQLGVRYLLEGSVRKAAGRVRIVIKLIDAGDGSLIWTERFEDILEDVFALQDRVALRAAGTIEPTVQTAEVRRATKRPTENMGSYDLYLRGWPLHRKYTKADTLQALDLVNRAIDLDPEYGSALVLAAVCHNLIDLYGWSDDAEANRRRGVEMARRALAAAGDDASVLAHAAFAVAHLERDEGAAVALLERAIALNPGCSAVWFMSGLIRLRVGNTDLAISHLETAMRLDPIGPDLPNEIGFMAWACFQQRRFRESITLAKEFVRQKDHPRGYAFLAASYGHLGEVEAAKEALGRYRALAPQPIDAFARSFILDPDHQKLFLDGIALADV